MIKIGIIGSGFGLYGLLPAFNKVVGCKVQSICGKKTERLLGYCRQIGLKNIYTDWREMLENEELDALAIAVVPSAQYEIAKFAFKKGLNVFLEKPLAQDFKKAKELYNLSKKYHINTAVDFIFPEIPEWVKAKEILTSESLGKLLAIKSDWDFLSFDLKNQLKTWKTDSRKGGGALNYYFSHVLYYLEYFAGKIVEQKNILINNKLSLNGAETGISMIFRTQKKVVGSANFSCSSLGLKKHSLVFICEKGSIVLENNTDVAKSFVLKVLKEGEEKVIKCKKPYIKNLDERVFLVKRIAERFIQACRTKSKSIPSIEHGLRVQELISKINIDSL